jgi:hypothetical protein
MPAQKPFPYEKNSSHAQKLAKTCQAQHHESGSNQPANLIFRSNYGVVAVFCALPGDHLLSLARCIQLKDVLVQRNMLLERGIADAGGACRRQTGLVGIPQAPQGGVAGNQPLKYNPAVAKGAPVTRQHFFQRSE